MLENLQDTISEMGSSEIPAVYTIKYVNGGGFLYQTILYTLLHGFLPTSVMDVLGLSVHNVSLSTWVTEYANHTYSGLGYSFIAEAYMNYGKVGWIFVMIYGWFIAMAENSAYKRIIEGKYLYATVMLAILSQQIFYARANLVLIDTYYRYSVYILIAWIIFAILIPGRSELQEERIE